jgi:hypothetical protein
MSEYPDYEAMARLEYGRMLWRKPSMQAALVRHWTDPRHPYRERFAQHRSLIERLFTSAMTDEQLDRQLRLEGTSLRAAMREIPPVFGQFWKRD